VDDSVAESAAIVAGAQLARRRGQIAVHSGAAIDSEGGAATLGGKYEVLARLGGGGMGETFLVRHRHLEQARVVKVMRPELTGDEELRERFLREARIASRIEHPRIARLHDFEVAEDGSAFLVLEYVPGYSLAELRSLPGAGPMPAAAVAELGLEVTEALQHLHAAGFLHRDVSPDNVMAYLDGRGAAGVKLIDLGIAKALRPSAEIAGTRGDAFLGKPLYASPEQIRTEELTPASDFYSLGAMLYELATGVFPYRYTNLASLLAAHLDGAPIPFAQSDPAGRVPEALRATILGLLAKDPARRFVSPDRLAIELALAAGDRGPTELAERVRAAMQALGARDAAGRADRPAHPTLQAELDRRFQGATGSGAGAAATEVSGVAPTVILGGPADGAGRTAQRTEVSPPRAPDRPAPPGAGSTGPPLSAPAAKPGFLAAGLARASRRYPALGQPRGRLLVAAVAGGFVFLALLVLVFWIVGKVPQDDPLEAVIYSVPENFRIDLGLNANYGWKQTFTHQLFSVTAFLPGLAAGAAGAASRRRGWPALLGMLLAALAAFAFLAPYFPPLGTYYHYDPFPLVAVTYLAAGAAAGRLGAGLDRGLAEP
jgi:serine/threonine-protein kinase